MKKKLISLLIAVVLILTMLPVTAMALTAPGKPSNLKATVSGSTTKLSWTAGKNCDGYTVEDIYGDFDDEVLCDAYIVFGGSTTTCTITEQDNSVPHVILVFSFVEDSSAPNGVTHSDDPIIYLSAPRLSISKSDGKVKLSWPTDGADKYYIYRGTSPDNLSYYDTTYNTSYTNSSVTSGTRYYYAVKAVCEWDGEMFYSAKSSVKSTIPLTTPQLSVSMSSGAAKLSWGSVKGATKYYIYRCTDGKNFKYYDSTTKTSYTNSSVTGGNKYYYKVKAIKNVNGADWVSDYSTAKSVNILKTPTISVTKNDGKITVSWSAVSNAAKYYIYRCTDGVNFNYYDSTTKTSYTNSSVTSGTRYYYKVKAVDANGGATVQSEAKSTVPVATPVMTKCDLDGSRVSLQWNAAKNATKYWVYRSTDGVNFNYYASTTSTSYTDNNITFGQDYTYYIKAVVTINGTDWSSSPSQSMSTVPLS